MGPVPLSAYLEDDLPAIPAPAGLLYPRPSDEYQGFVASPGTTVVTSPGGEVPQLSSLPGAKANLYLNFLGDTIASYGQFGSFVVPAYSRDSDTSTFSSSELDAIRAIWSYVAEDYAPFNINVTTVQPTNMSHGVTQKVDIGGDGSWTGKSIGGISYVNDFTMSSLPNISFVFPDHLASGEPKYTADAASHEAGHSFGLEHQSKYSGSVLVAEYSPGPGGGVAPLMGNSYMSRRSLWWYGQSAVSWSTMQDDMAIIGGSNNGFSFRQVAASSAASPLSPAIQDGTSLGASGLIVRGQQQDYYRVDVGAGASSFTVTVPDGVSNLSPVVTLYDSTGAIPIATATVSTDDFSAHLDATLEAGSYRLVVSGGGQYGNVGTYSLSGTIVAPSSGGGATGGGTTGGTGGNVTVPITPSAPQRLTVTSADASGVGLAWSDVLHEAGFVVDRSNDGANWGVLATVGAGVTTFRDGSVLASTTYFYRVRSLYGGAASAPSPVVQVATPAPVIPVFPTPPVAVTGTTVLSKQARQVVLGWTASTSPATYYQVERSLNGKKWAVVGQVAAPTTSFSDTSVAPNRTYFYRVRAVNPYGVSPADRSVRVTTPRQVVVLMRRKVR